MWDYPDELITSLGGRQRQLLHAWNGIPVRVLGMLLRFLLAPIEGTGGVMVDGVSLDAVVGNIRNKAVSYAAIDDGASVAMWL